MKLDHISTEKTISITKQINLIIKMKVYFSVLHLKK